MFLSPCRRCKDIKGLTCVRRGFIRVAGELDLSVSALVTVSEPYDQNISQLIVNIFSALGPSPDASEHSLTDSLGLAEAELVWLVALKLGGVVITVQN